MGLEPARGMRKGTISVNGGLRAHGLGADDALERRAICDDQGRALDLQELFFLEVRKESRHRFP